MSFSHNIQLLLDNNLFHFFVGTSILFLFIGAIISFFIIDKLSYNVRVKISRIMFSKIRRFFRNVLNLSPIILVLILLYYAFKLFDYGEEILPELIGTGISVLIINFIIKEKEYNEKSKIDKILKNKIKQIIDISNQMILKYIDAEDYININLNKDTLYTILKKQDLRKSEITYKNITQDGIAEIKQISKLDYLFYVRKELYPLIHNFISSYGIYLEYRQLSLLMSLQEILERNIFRGRLSVQKDNIDDDIYKKYLDVIVELLLEINKIILKFNIKGDVNKDVE